MFQANVDRLTTRNIKPETRNQYVGLAQLEESSEELALINGGIYGFNN